MNIHPINQDRHSFSLSQASGQGLTFERMLHSCEQSVNYVVSAMQPGQVGHTV